MKSYQFHLQPLLQLRNQMKEQLFQNWAASNLAHQNALREKEQLEKELNSWQEKYRDNSNQSISGKDFWREQRAASVLRQQWMERSKTQEFLQQRAKLAFQAWQEARKKEEALEKLKQRSKLDWTRDFERQEQKQLDERSGFQFYQNTMMRSREKKREVA